MDESTVKIVGFLAAIAVLTAIVGLAYCASHVDKKPEKN